MGKWFGWELETLVPSTRPTMTSSRGSHSLYEHTGLFRSWSFSLSKSSARLLAGYVTSRVPAHAPALLLMTRVEHARRNCNIIAEMPISRHFFSLPIRPPPHSSNFPNILYRRMPVFSFQPFLHTCNMSAGKLQLHFRFRFSVQ